MHADHISVQCTYFCARYGYGHICPYGRCAGSLRVRRDFRDSLCFDYQMWTLLLKYEDIMYFYCKVRHAYSILGFKGTDSEKGS